MVKHYLLKNKLLFIGAILGAIIGFIYWNANQSTSELETSTCIFKTSAFNSIVWSGVLCSLFLGLFQSEDNDD